MQRYARLRDLAERAKVWNKLYDPVLPPIFLKWAEDNEIVIPPDLSEKVEKLKGKFVDWKKRCEELQAAYDNLYTSYESFREMYGKHVADWKDVVGKKSDLIEAANLRIAELEGELAAVNGAPPAPEPAKAQSLIERQNMLKAIFGMAVRGYSYNPADKRSKTVGEIVSDLELEGIPLSDDTIRRYLKEARELLNEWQQQAGYRTTTFTSRTRRAANRMRPKSKSDVIISLHLQLDGAIPCRTTRPYRTRASCALPRSSPRPGRSPSASPLGGRASRMVASRSR